MERWETWYEYQKPAVYFPIANETKMQLEILLYLGGAAKDEPGAAINKDREQLLRIINLTIIH